MVAADTTAVGPSRDSVSQIRIAHNGCGSAQQNVAGGRDPGADGLVHRGGPNMQQAHSSPRSDSIKGEGGTANDRRGDMQQYLRKKMLRIQGDSSISEAEKARRMQDLMSISWKRYIIQRKKKMSLANAQQHKHARRKPGETTLEDLRHSYHDIEKGILGCKHYQRAVKFQCDCCNIWSVCRFCHDEFSNHEVTSNLISKMLCMYCGKVQPIGKTCINEQCRRDVANYFCKTCLLWDSDSNKNIYHCEKCGICRIGKGLGIDYFHCDKCGVCLAISLYKNHRCIERNVECNCPICGEYMFTSTSTIMFMRCCHCIHVKCYKEYIKKYYQCPTCFKSLADMTEFFNRVDIMLAMEKMPKEYEAWYSQIYCNDCETKCLASYHFIYHKCSSCEGYNTKVIDLIKNPEEVSKVDILKIEELRKKILSKALDAQKNAHYLTESET